MIIYAFSASNYGPYEFVEAIIGYTSDYIINIIINFQTSSNN